jgi:uncharacterized protein YndB with AHSA1/START domain
MPPTKLEVLAEPGQPTIICRRWVDAPRPLVFEAHVRPEQLVRWWGPRNFVMAVCELDVRVGGSYRFLHRGADGRELGFHGEYRELERPVRMVQTLVYEGVPDAEWVKTTELEERDGGTLITTVSLFKSIAARDRMMATKMEASMADSYDRLDELTRPLRPR